MKRRVISNTHRTEALEILNHFREAARVGSDFDKRYFVCLKYAVENTYSDIDRVDDKWKIRDFPDSELYESDLMDFLVFLEFLDDDLTVF